MLEIGDRFLVLRYSNGIYNTIQQHKDVLQQCGYCWFGKIGMSPSEQNIRSILDPDRMLAVLYCQGDAFICDILDLTGEQPSEGYPQYYESFMYNRGVYPKMYFKLGSIEPLDKDIFAKCIAFKSRKPLFDTVSRSMASFFYGEYPSETTPLPERIEKPRKPRTTAEKRKKAPVAVDNNSCIYKIDGRCTNRRCISYEYECDRPRSCAKQKPREIPVS